MQFQSTFPRGERPLVTDGAFPASISIHVPAWGTTGVTTSQQMIQSISIHVPAWGTTTQQWGNHVRKLDFNPRSRVGNDDCNFLLMAQRDNFNPRSRVGNDK